ncbi:MAG: FGGY-family carbohydrate kinase, partial [Defluviitaleaceae bacterium]|nr:FGGY-family carbohydrate kinase [Defluviitaleaceae bacterium]
AAPKSGRLIGGGAKSPLWCQIIANVMDMRIEKIASSEGPAYGAALLAAVGWSACSCGLGGGAFDSVEEACEKFVKVTEVYEPDEETAKLYTAKYEIFTKLYRDLKGTFGEMGK